MIKVTTPDWASVPMSPEAQAFYENTFLPRYKELLEKVSQTPLVVLVWGPGQSGGDLYEKRLQIRGQLRTLGLSALCSEEINIDPATTRFSAKVSELCQAIAADLIVVLQGSPGSTAEAHDFAEFIQEIGRKMLIFIDERAKEGYSYMGALQELKTLYNNVETYNYPRDIKECSLTRAVQKKIQVLQAVKWRASIR